MALNCSFSLLECLLERSLMIIKVISSSKKHNTIKSHSESIYKQFLCIIIIRYLSLMSAFFWNKNEFIIDLSTVIRLSPLLKMFKEVIYKNLSSLFFYLFELSVNNWIVFINKDFNTILSVMSTVFSFH